MLFKKKKSDNKGGQDKVEDTEKAVETSLEESTETAEIQPSISQNEVDTSIKEKPKKKEKESKRSKKEPIPDVPRNLYLLVEKDIPGIRGYFKGHGAPLKSLRTSVEDMKIDLLIESEPCRLIIAEAGLGKFTSTAMRAELVDLIGMCNGEDKKLTIFFTNSVVKSDAHRKGFGKQANKIDWQQYSTTLGIISYLKSLGETYIDNVDSDGADEQDTAEKKIAKLFKFKGERVEAKVPELETSVSNTWFEIAEHLEEDGLPAFKVAY